MASSTTTEETQANLSEDLVGLAKAADKNFVTLETLAQLLGVTYRTARKYILPTKDSQGNEIAPAKIKAIQVGGQYRIYEDEVRRFLEFGNRKA